MNFSCMGGTWPGGGPKFKERGCFEQRPRSCRRADLKVGQYTRKGRPPPAFAKTASAGRRNGRDCYVGADMELRNSALALVFERRLRRSSMASTVERGLKTLRKTQTRLSSSGGRRSSSLRVPER